jgi:hypothetical protein
MRNGRGEADLGVPVSRCVCEWCLITHSRDDEPHRYNVPYR